MIKIGVSSCLMHPDLKRSVFGPKQLDYFENDMANYIIREDVTPILIPYLDEKFLNQYINQVDALILQGGADIAPETYGEVPIENERWPGDIVRDAYEFKLIELALKRNIPVLGICRGMQLLNTFFGGTLFQDISLQANTNLTHRCAQKYDSIYHEVQNMKDSIMLSLYENEFMLVNSVHHQAVKDLGLDLIVESISNLDCIVEAFRYKDLEKYFILAVQWHPEFNHSLKNTIPSGRPIIDYFLNEVRKRKAI